jgi:hypothetical protein
VLRLTSRRGPLIAALVCSVLAGVAAAAAALPSSARITTAGLGPIKIGMTVAQVEQAGKRELSFEGGDVNAPCATASLGTNLFGLFSKGRLARVYVRSRRYASQKGIRVGDTQRKLVASYASGALARSPHKYVRGGYYFKLTIASRRLVFETDGRRVTEMSSGRKPEIDYVEGCA